MLATINTVCVSRAKSSKTLSNLHKIVCRRKTYSNRQRRVSILNLSSPTDSDIKFSGLDGKALKFPHKDQFPSRSQVLSSIPEECFKKDTLCSIAYASLSTALTLLCGAAAYAFIPLNLSWWPVWLGYAAVTGTIATGCWVIAHECGHNAFSENRFIQNFIGYILHSALLVPYYSWQRSHAVHHSRTNHLTEGETHVPHVKGEMKGDSNLKAKKNMGKFLYTFTQLITHLMCGWPAYLLTGATGGSSRGVTNHFLPWINSGKLELFPGNWKKKVLFSDIGVLAAVITICYWVHYCGVMPFLSLYFGPYLFVNAWLVMYTWLQHTETDVQHLAAEEWSYIKGAFPTVDRPYGLVFDFLHHRIGSTHVAHHVECSIPHYKAQIATCALKAKYPDFYLYDPTPIWSALLRVASSCVAVEKRSEGKETMWTFTSNL